MTLQAFTRQVLPGLVAAANPFGGLERELDGLARGFCGWSASGAASPAAWRLDPPAEAAGAAE